MGLYHTAENTSAYLKMGITGETGTGKSMTAAKTMIGLVQYARAKKLPGCDKPVDYFDTENGSDWLIGLFDNANIQLRVAKRRSFADLLAAIDQSEAEAFGQIIDSLTHPWVELCESYLKKKQRTHYEISDWNYLKGNQYGWGRYTTRFLNSKLHQIMCGRAGDIFNNYIDEEGRRQMEKIGTKMRVEGQTAYEPSLLVLMKQVEDGRTKRVIHRAIVQKDRSTLIDGKEFDNPGFENFLPHIECLRLGGPHVGIEQAADSQNILGIEKRDWQPVQREICIDEIQTLLTLHYPSQSAEDKKNKLKAILQHFDATWTEIEKVMPLPDLRAGYDSLYRALEGKPSRYAAAIERDKPVAMNDELPAHSAPPIVRGTFTTIEVPAEGNSFPAMYGGLVNEVPAVPPDLVAQR
jgi:hypothetical protein